MLYLSNSVTVARHATEKVNRSIWLKGNDFSFFIWPSIDAGDSVSTLTGLFIAYELRSQLLWENVTKLVVDSVIRYRRMTLLFAKEWYYIGINLFWLPCTTAAYEVLFGRYEKVNEAVAAFICILKFWRSFDNTYIRLYGIRMTATGKSVASSAKETNQIGRL